VELLERDAAAAECSATAATVAAVPATITLGSFKAPLRRASVALRMRQDRACGHVARPVLPAYAFSASTETLFTPYFRDAFVALLDRNR
jgi:hypothetical protein